MASTDPTMVPTSSTSKQTRDDDTSATGRVISKQPQVIIRTGTNGSSLATTPARPRPQVEPEPEPIQSTSSVAPPSAAVADTTIGYNSMAGSAMPDVVMTDIKQENLGTPGTMPSSLPAMSEGASPSQAPGLTPMAVLQPSSAAGPHVQHPQPHHLHQQPPRSRTSTPVRSGGNSHAGGVPDATAMGGKHTAGPGEGAVLTAPSQPVEHGAPCRRYLNSKVTPTLLAGMRQLAAERPSDPLRFLGEYLLQRSKELEGT